MDSCLSTAFRTTQQRTSHGRQFLGAVRTADTQRNGTNEVKNQEGKTSPRMIKTWHSQRTWTEVAVPAGLAPNIDVDRCGLDEAGSLPRRVESE